MADSGTGRGSGCHDFRRRGRSRRDALRAGALAMTGLGLPELFRNRAVAAGPGGFGRAKSCLLIFMWGGPSQLDTWDPKPDAPAEIRGSFKTIATKTPGVRISEHFPMLATRTDKLAIVRSLCHDDFTHLSTAPPGHDRARRADPVLGRGRAVAQRLAASRFA